MDNKWSGEAWHPTSKVKPQFVSNEKRQQAFDKLASVTTNLSVLPYNGGLWAQRADILAQVGYPELAAGDARKAQKLFAAMGNTKVDGHCLQARRQLMADKPGGTMDIPAGLLHNQKFWDQMVQQFHFGNFQTLAGALHQIEAHYSLREMCIEARALYPNDDIFSSALAGSTAAVHDWLSKYQQAFGSAEAGQRVKSGHLSFRKYPFMAPKYLERSPALIEAVNSQLGRKDAPCAIRASSVGPQTQQSAPMTLSKNLSWKSATEFYGRKVRSNTFGLFATSNIEQGKVIFIDETSWGATTMPAINKINLPGLRYAAFRCEMCCGMTMIWHKVIHQAECCTTFYCSNYCLEEAKATYHKVICGKDFTWLTTSPQAKATPVHTYDLDGIMWLRILAICVQSGVHPLDHPLIAALTPNYESPDEVGRRWSLETHIDVPQRILTALGMDIFTDVRYDTWVLQTIWARMINNVRGGPQEGFIGQMATKGINPLYSFINHNCEPNANAVDVWTTFPPQKAPVHGSSTVAIVANKTIRPGEEIYISYVDHDASRTRQRRNFELTKNWLNQECQCTRCKREA